MFVTSLLYSHECVGPVQMFLIGVRCLEFVGAKVTLTSPGLGTVATLPKGVSNV